MQEITSSAIEIQKVIGSVLTPESGGINVFMGTTRNHSHGRRVLALEYEAYAPMAIKMMERIEQEARGRWSLQKIAIVHRLGRVEIGEVSVLIAVSSSHRLEAFEACRYLIDRLKEIVPIWKREFYADGTVEWTGRRASQNVPSAT